jgi:hypothetical protein
MESMTELDRTSSAPGPGALGFFRGRGWRALGLEGLVLIAGILLAFQLDRAYQASQDRKLETRYLERLREDLQSDTAEVYRVVSLTAERLEQVALLREAARDPGVATERPAAVVEAVEKVTWRSFPRIRSYTYDELQSTGRMSLLRSESLRSGLGAYYALVEDRRRLGLGEDDQDRFRLETLGLLSAEHFSAIEDPGRYPAEVAAADAVEIARELAARPEALAWLPRLTKYQVLMRRSAEEVREAAVVLMEEIDAQVAGTGPDP